MAYEFVTPKTATIKMPTAFTAGGYIAAEGDTPAGNKAFAISGVKTAATLAESATVFDTFIGDIAGGTFDSTTAVKTVTYTVENVQEQQEP